MSSSLHLPPPVPPSIRRPFSVALLVAAILGPAIIASLLAVGEPVIALLLTFGIALIAWSFSDVRVAVLVAVGAASFVNYGGGRLTLELGAVCGWLGIVAAILALRSRAVPLIMPPRAVLTALMLWGAVCALGVGWGVMRGNSLRYLGLELLGASWPFVALLFMQAFDIRKIRTVGIGLFLIGLLHMGIGVLALRVIGQRVGGVFFTTLPGLIAVGFWTFALFEQERKTRWLLLFAMVPLLVQLLLSFTRGYWLGFLVGIFVATLLYLTSGTSEPSGGVRRVIRYSGVFVGLSGITAVVAMAFLGDFSLLEAIVARFNSSFTADAGGQTASNYFRLIEYSLALEGIKSAPVIGNGFGHSFVWQDPIFGDRIEQWIVHNYYLLVTLKTGLVGLFLLLGFLWKLVRPAWRARNAVADPRARSWIVATLAITAQILAISFVNYPLAQVISGFFMAFLWGGVWALLGREPVPAATRPTRCAIDK